MKAMVLKRICRLDQDHLWLEKKIESVANVTRKDIGDFLRIAADIPLVPKVEEFGLSDATRL